MLITLGVNIAALGLDIFLLPNRIMDGGITGISIILSNLTDIKFGVFLIVLNIPFLIIGYKNLGTRFLVKASYAIIMYSILSVKYTNVYVINHDGVFSAIFGGITLGIGIGLVMLGSGCTDGTEVIAILVSKESSLSVGQVILIINVIIFTIGGALFGPEKALYSVMAYYLNAKAMDIVANGLTDAKECRIIGNDLSDIAKEIYTRIGRTATLTQVRGLVSDKNKEMLIVVLTRLEVPEVRNIVREDGNAFMTVYDVLEVVGNHIKKTKSEVVKRIS